VHFLFSRVYFLLFSLLVTCSVQADENDAVYQAVVAQQSTFMSAFEQGDVDGLVSLYSPSAQLLPANQTVVKGSEQIGHFWAGLMQLGIKTVKLTTLEAEGQDSPYEVGRYTIHTANGDMIDYGKYLIVWHRIEGQWLIHRHMWTTSLSKANESRI